jgi:hypothetical protein
MFCKKIRAQGEKKEEERNGVGKGGGGRRVGGGEGGLEAWGASLTDLI